MGYIIVAVGIYTVLVMVIAATAHRRGFYKAIRYIESGKLRLGRVRQTRTREWWR